MILSDMSEACGMPITRSAVQDTYLGVGIPGSEASGASGGGGASTSGSSGSAATPASRRASQRGHGWLTGTTLCPRDGDKWGDRQGWGQGTSNFNNKNMFWDILQVVSRDFGFSRPASDTASGDRAI